MKSKQKSKKSGSVLSVPGLGLLGFPETLPKGKEYYSFLNEEIYSKILLAVAAIQAEAFPDNLSDREHLAHRLKEHARRIEQLAQDCLSKANYMNPSPKYVRVPR